MNIKNRGKLIHDKNLHCKKKVNNFPIPQPGCHPPPPSDSPCPGIIKLIPTRESLVSNIPAGDEKIVNLFYSVVTHSLGI
jgi:hypothetical protein